MNLQSIVVICGYAICSSCVFVECIDPCLEISPRRHEDMHQVKMCKPAVCDYGRCRYCVVIYTHLVQFATMALKLKLCMSHWHTVDHLFLQQYT